MRTQREIKALGLGLSRYWRWRTPRSAGGSGGPVIQGSFPTIFEIVLLTLGAIAHDSLAGIQADDDVGAGVVAAQHAVVHAAPARARETREGGRRAIGSWGARSKSRDGVLPQRFARR